MQHFGNLAVPEFSKKDLFTGPATHESYISWFSNNGSNLNHVINYILLEYNISLKYLKVT